MQDFTQVRTLTMLAQKAIVFVSGKFFQVSTKFASNAEFYPSDDPYDARTLS